MLQKDARRQALSQWLGLKAENLQPLNGDASLRRYFRVPALNAVAVDAPPATQKNIEFIDTAKRLTQVGVRVPQILRTELLQGFLLQEDLGDTVFAAQACSADAMTQRTWYLKAAALLPSLALVRTQGLPAFDADFIHMELGIFTQWLLDKRLHLTLSPGEQQLLKQTFARLTQILLALPQRAMHRDFHCRNLMVLKDQSLAVIDFQDMVTGPLGYDLASLIYDCYVELPPLLVDEILELTYWRYQYLGLLPGISRDEFAKAVTAVSLQRHLKVLGIFNRLWLRDGKPGYLKDLPRVFDYTLRECQALPEFGPLAEFLVERVQEVICAR